MSPAADALPRGRQSVFARTLRMGFPSTRTRIGTSLACGSEHRLNILRISDVKVAKINIEGPAASTVSFNACASPGLVELPMTATRESLGMISFQKLQLFAAHLGGQSRQSSNVSTRSRQARDKPAADRVGILPHDDRYRRSCFLEGTGYCRPSRDDEVHLKTHELGGNLAATLGFSFCRAPLDDDVLALDIAELAETLAKSFDATGDRRSRSVEVKSYARGFRRLLCLRGRNLLPAG